MDKRELKITTDGSHTLYIPELDETYHSKHGAIQEAKHVFIEAGLKYLQKIKLNILEVGFGTGLNTFLTLLEADKKRLEINYVGVEAFPLEQEVIEQLNYTKELNSNTEEIILFNKLHEIEWGRERTISSSFVLNKQQIELDNFQIKNKFDVIYFDAFGPRVQPKMWTEDIFKKMYDCLNEGGILVTYCAKGSVKRGLKGVGFKLESLPGPPGKREMTRALKV